MKLVFIYGPPAAGKLTISKELSKITSLKVCHNQIINDLLDEFLEKKDKYYWSVGDKLKNNLINVLAKSKIKGLIVTMVRGDGKDSLILAKKIRKSIKESGGKYYCVRLMCDREELLKRVKNKSRKSYGKITTKKLLLECLKKYGLDNSLPFKNQLIINNTHVPAKKVAKQIKKHFRL